MLPLILGEGWGEVKAQKSKTDSLKKVIARAKQDTNKVKLLIQLGNQYKNSIPDTTLFYFQKALDISKNIKAKNFIAISLRYIGNIHRNQCSYDKAMSYYLEGFKIFEELGNSPDAALAKAGKTGMSHCYNNIGIVHMYQGSYDKAMEYYLKSLEIKKGIGDRYGMSASYINIGIVHSDQGSYDKAIEYYLKSLKIKEEFGDKYGISSCYNLIGTVYNNLCSYDRAMEYYLKSLKIKEELGDKRGMSACYNNIGVTCSDQGSYNKAIEYYLKSLKLDEELNDKQGMSSSYQNIGINHKEQGSYDKAISYFLKSLKINEELGDKNGVAAIYNNIASLNIILADSVALTENQRLNYLNKVVEYGNKSIELAKEIDAMPTENDAAEILMTAYEKLGKYKKAIEFAGIFISTKDSMFSGEKTKALTDLQVKYEREKKQLQIEKMEKQKQLDKKTIEAQQAQNRKQLVIIFSVLMGFIVVLVFSIIIMRMFRQKRKANVLLSQQKQEISEKNEELNQLVEEITTQKDEIETQRDNVEKQKQVIEEIHHEVSQSIDYATRLQESILPEEKLLTKYLADHFVLFKPKDKVSGDFYWWTHIENHTIITAADCTGHGVPGAFMSMLGVSFLREIVNKEYITHTGVILRKLRKEIIKALKQKGEMGEQKDGMDMALISFNHETNVVQYSGANNPLYIITNETRNLQGFQNLEGFDGFYEIKPDKMPIAIYEKMDKFNTHEIQLQKDDMLFMFSDGYPDQFGGPKGKKFKYKPFKSLLLENADKPMAEQQEILNAAFENWKGNLEQIDDVCVIGVKI